MTTTIFSIPTPKPLPSFTPVSPTSGSHSSSKSSSKSSSVSTLAPTPLPLTTIFTPNPDCTKTISMVFVDETFSQFWIGYGWMLGIVESAPYPTSCYPSGFQDVLTDDNNAGYYSPGVCPSGYITATTTASSSAAASLSLKSGETIAFCCPQDYGYDDSAWNAIYNQCVSPISKGRTVMGVYSLESIGRSVIPNSTTWTTTVNMLDTVTAAAIQIRWRAGDSSILNLAHETPPVLYSPPGAPFRVTNVSLIVIAVLVPVIAISLIIGGIVVFLRRRRQKQQVDIDATIFDLPEVVDKSNMNTSLEYSRVGFFNANEKIVVHPPTLVQSYRPSTDQVRTIQRQPEDGKEVVEEMSASPAPQAASLQVTTSDSQGVVLVEEHSSAHSQPGTPSQSPDRTTLETELRRIREEREQRELELLRRKEQELVEELARQNA